MAYNLAPPFFGSGAGVDVGEMSFDPIADPIDPIAEDTEADQQSSKNAEADGINLMVRNWQHCRKLH